MHDILMSFGQLALACVLGGMIGYERQSRRKAAGLRTNILVCLGSTFTQDRESVSQGAP